MKFNIYKRNRCRICNCSDMKLVIGFDNMPFTDTFVSEDKIGSEFLAAINIFWCKKCKTVQTLHDIEITDYYKNYHYSVSFSTFAQNYMQRLQAEVFKRFDFKENDSVVEIGSGDGCQLKYFQERGARVIGFEPSIFLTKQAIKRGIPTLPLLFNSDTVKQIPKNMLPLKLVILSYTFDHIPDPTAILKTISSILDTECGVIVIEVHDLEKIIARKEICLFQHEHSIYVSKLTMQRLLKRSGFKIISYDLLSESERRGNSLLVVASLENSKYKPDTIKNQEKLLSFDKWETYIQFKQEIKKSLSKFKNYINNLNIKRKKIAGFGAGGRGVMTIAMAGLNQNDILYLCDNNKDFYGLYTPSTHIPIVKPAYLIKNPVDELIVFSFGYLDEIKEQLKGYPNFNSHVVSLLEVI